MQTLQIITPPSPYQPCAICGHPHFFPVSIYAQWIEQFGMRKVFVTGKKAGRPTQRTAQTERWSAIVEKHESRP